MRTTTTRGAPPTRRVLLGVALISGVTLAFQVVFTRLMASVVAYHFSFLAISLALLGAGAGGLVIYVAPQRFERPSTEAVLARWSAYCALALLACPLVFIAVDIGSGRSVDFGFGIRLAVISISAATVSFTAGVVIALAIRTYTASISRVYSWDLLGAGLGALVIVPLLVVPAPVLIGILALVVGGASVLLDPPRRRPVTLQSAILGVVLIAVLTTPLTGLLDLDPPPVSRIARDEWTPLARVVSYDFGPTGDYSVVLYDNIVAPVVPVEGDEIPDWRRLVLGAQSVPYAFRDQPGHTLVIGGGGGRDIYNALSNDQKVDVIELNEAIREGVDEALADRSGSPYSRPGVSTTIGDGRSVLARRDTKYDHINIGFTDTLTPSAAQGFALTENNLYTTEAFDEYYDHLAPGGILSVSRLDALVGEESLRATVLTLAALEEQGIEHPERHVVVVRGRDVFGGRYGTVLSRLTPFTAAEVARLETLSQERGNGLAFAPEGPYVAPFDQLAEQGWSSFCNGYHLDVCPPTDDRPFFFNMRRPSQVGQESQAQTYLSVDPYDIIVLTFGILVVLSIVGLLLPMLLVRNERRPPLTSLAYFAAIGLGFLLMEVVLVQRFVLFLGFPTYALSVVLFALLLFTGLGARLSSRFLGARSRSVALLAVVVVLLVSTVVWLQPLLEALIDLPFAARVAVSVAVIGPMGLLLGMPMPIGLDRQNALHPSGVPFAWGVNGVASVVASVLAVLIALIFGFTAVALTAAACYGVALLHAALGRWPEQPAAASEPQADVDNAMVASSSS